MRNKKKPYSQITRREILFSYTFIILIFLILIAFSIRDIINGQLFRPIIDILLAVFILLFFGFIYRKNKQTKISNQVDQSQYELSSQERFSVKSSILEESSSEESDVPFIAKVVLCFFLLLLVGVGLFVFTVFCRFHNFSTTEVLILSLIIISLAVLWYFIIEARWFSPSKIINGQVLLRRLTVTEQIIAVVSLISLCIGVVLWFFH